MNRHLLLGLGALLWIGQSTLWGGEPRQLQLKWGELGPRVEDHKIAMVLPDGTHIEGKVRAVQPDGMRLRVTKTSDRKVQPKGDHLIRRESISVLRVTEYGTKGRWLVTTGAIATAAAIVAANKPDLYEGPAVIIVPAVTAGGLVGVGVAGYFAGKALDKHVTEIRVVRE
jgi:hypothetical protein